MIFFALFPGKNALHVIVLVPSYMSILKITFPDFVSLSSIDCISPSMHTFPDSTFKSFIFTSGSLIFIDEPKISGVLSSSSGSGGNPSSDISAMMFAITVISPAYASSPAFPVVFIAFADFIFSNISFPFAPSSANDLHVIIPVPSYNSNISIPFPVLVSLHSLFTILPSSVILPAFASMSFIFIFFSFAFEAFPNMMFSACGSSSPSGA